MSNKPQSPSTFVEVFPIRVENLPQITSYTLNTRGNEQQVSTGRKLADRLTRRLGGYWVWSEAHILTNLPQQDFRCR